MLLAAIRDSVERGFDEFFSWLPSLLGALVILVIGYFVAKIVGKAVHRLLLRAGFDRTLTEGQGGTWISKVTSSPSQLLGRIAFWALFLGAISLAVTALGIDALTDFVAAIYAYLPHVVAALLIFIVASMIAAGIAALVARTMGDTPTGKVIATVAPGLVMAIAVFMILQELQIAEGIVTITYAALIGSLALAAALAFGLGGREVAGRMLEAAYQKGQQSREQVRRDLEVGRERARADVDRARESIEGDAVAGPPSRESTHPPVATVNATGETMVVPHEGSEDLDRPGRP
jgi:Conserved TM helix